MLAAAAAGMLLLLTACTGLPTSGAVNPGNDPIDTNDAPSIDLRPDPPLEGASPEQIVDGFIRAGSGPQDNWATAREYLTPEFAAQWRPEEGVTIDRLAERTTAAAEPTSTPSGGEDASVHVTQRITAEATVSEIGEYAPADGKSVELPFRLVRNDEGEWRIAEARNGVVLYREVFPVVYQTASVMFFDPTWEYLVPDVRWFPSPLLTARVAAALIDGPPSEWLAAAVSSAFPENVSLVGGAVPVVDDTAQVELTSAALALDSLTLDRMQTQLEASLRSVYDGEVQMTVETTPLDAQPVSVRSTRVDPSPLVQLEGGEFGFLGAESIEAIPGLSQAVESANPTAIAVSPDRASAAVLTRSGAVVRALEDGTVGELDLARPGLVAPSVDPYGTVWSVPGSDPDAFLAFPVEGDPIPLLAPWPGATELAAFQVSRDGTRLAALVVVNGRTEVWTAGILRDGATPVALGEPVVVSTSTSPGIDLAWLDDTTLGVLLASGESASLLRQPIGGVGRLSSVPSGVVSVSGGNSSARLRTSDGVLLVERGSNWEQGADGVRVLAVQQGQPQ
jgi:hypothetical protein